MKKPTIVCMYIAFSSGHKAASDAIMSSIKHLYPETNTIGIDSVKYAFPATGDMISATYLGFIRTLPQIWEYMYDNPGVVEATKELRDFANATNMWKIKRMLKKYNPDAVVCTQAAPAHVIASGKRTRKFHVPLFAVVTDYAVHAYWIQRGVDYYVVANEYSKRQLIENGVRKDSIYVLGIPIDRKFKKYIEKPEARKKLGLDSETTTVLVLGGGQGLGSIEETAYALGQMPDKFQIVVVTGYNKRLRRRLEKFSKHCPKLLKPLGYVHNMPVIMDASDIVITKPGGVTTAECLIKGLPMVVFEPIPGQEVRNAGYLMRHDTALIADGIDELYRVVQQLVKHPGKREEMSKRALAIARPDASEDIARLIMEKIGA